MHRLGFTPVDYSLCAHSTRHPEHYNHPRRPRLSPTPIHHFALPLLQSTRRKNSPHTTPLRPTHLKNPRTIPARSWSRVTFTYFMRRRDVQRLHLVRLNYWLVFLLACEWEKM
jgi:hypothetical protein